MISLLSLNCRIEPVRGSDLRHAMLMRISPDPGHARKRGNFLRGTLGITARHHDLCIWVFAMDTANRGASILGSGGRDGTGIKAHHGGIEFGLGLSPALGRHLAF